MQADQKARKTTGLKANPEEMESEAEHQEVSKERATMKSSGALKKRHRGRNLVAVPHQKPKDGSRKKVAAAGRKARRKGCSHEGPSVEQGRRKNQTRNNVSRGAPRGQTFEKRRRWIQRAALE
jgi:hypothetical protein